MQNWIYFVLIAQGIWSITSLIDKIVISKGYIKNPLVYIVLNGLMNVFLIFLFPFVWFEPLKLIDVIIVIGSGAIFTASVTIYYKAVQHDEISRVVILSQLSPIFVLVLSFLLIGELLTTNSFIGFVSLLSAGFLVSYRKQEESFVLSKAFPYMLISSFLGAIAAVAAKYIYSITGFWNAFLWLRTSNFIALCVLLMPSIRKEFSGTYKRAPNKIKGLLGFKMIIDFSAFIFAGIALSMGPVSLVTALSSSIQPIFIFFLALFLSFYFPQLIKEEIDKKAVLIKVFAIILIIIGIVFINL